MNLDNVIAFVPRQPKMAIAPTRNPEGAKLMGEGFARVSKTVERGLITPVDAVACLMRHAMAELFVAGMAPSEIEATLRTALDDELTSSFFVEELEHKMERH